MVVSDDRENPIDFDKYLPHQSHILLLQLQPYHLLIATYFRNHYLIRCPASAAYVNCLNQTDTTYKEELGSLLTLRFQRFEKAQVVAV